MSNDKKAHKVGSIPTLSATRVRGQAMDELCSQGKASTREHNGRAMASKPFRLPPNRKIVETTAADFLEVLKPGTPNPFLRHLHNLALGLG